MGGPLEAQFGAAEALTDLSGELERRQHRNSRSVDLVRFVEPRFETPGRGVLHPVRDETDHGRLR